MTALNLAKYIVKRCYENGHPINNIKLQKILWNIHEKYPNQIFYDDFEEFSFGMAVPNVFYHYSGFGEAEIRPPFGVSTIQINEKDISKIEDLI